MLIDAAKSSLLIVDVQERLLHAMAPGNRVVERSVILLKAAKTLDVPVGTSCVLRKTRLRSRML